jgi:NtrC-family two-component system response regulator AlgB
MPARTAPPSPVGKSTPERYQLRMAPARLRVLVADDEKNIRTTLAVCLEDIGCEVVGASTGAATLDAVRRSSFDLVFLDLRLGDVDALDILPDLLRASPISSVVIITAYGTIETAVDAIKRGASDYLPKPFTPAQIRHVVEQLAERRALKHRVEDLQRELGEAVPGIDLTSQSLRMRAVLQTIDRAAPSDTAVLLRGENGTGKGVLARLLHARSNRREAPFVVVHCPTLSEELLTSELFGHVRGAFTGAIRDQRGRVEAAEHGTLFLDEIGDIPPGLQSKLLRFVQDREFERLGDNRTRQADVRIVAATNRDLERDVATGRFREDLYYRLNVIDVVVPPLRERPEDLMRLAHGFLEFFCRAAKRPLPELSPAAVGALKAHPWPGNVRELRNAVERAVILWPAQIIDAAAFGERISAQSTQSPRLGGDFTLEEIEREHLLEIVSRSATLEDAARVLGVDASTLWRKRKKYEEGE